MTPRTARYRLLSLLALATPLACPTGQGNHGTTGSGTGASGAVRSYTDSDVVTGVAGTASDVFVATYRGVARFPAGGGTPTRQGTAEGLPDAQVYAISSSGDGVTWAATAHGVVRWDGTRWASPSEEQPDVGRATAILALGAGQCLLGGAQGLARFDGSHWYKLTNQYQVTGFALDQGRPLVATAQAGVLALSGEFNSLDEFGVSAGIPELMVRNVVSIGNGQYWALVQGSLGSKLAYFDGHKWYGYTNGSVHTPWLAVVPTNHGTGAALVAQGGLYDITHGNGDPLVPTEAGQTDGQRRVTLQPTRVEWVPPAPPPAPVAPPSGRHPHPAGRGRHDVPVEQSPAERGAQHAPGRSTPGHPAGSATATTAATATTPDPNAPPPAPAAIHPRNIPPYAPPVDVPHDNSAHAPAFVLVRSTVASLNEDLAGVFTDPTGVFIARVGLGVSRVLNGPAADYRTHDLAMTHQALSLASDESGNVWLATDDHSVVRYDSNRFVHAALDADPAVVPLIFWSRGTYAAAVGRVGPNVLRTYRRSGGNWTQITERPIDTRGQGEVSLRFLAVDSRGRFWLGIRVENHDGGHDRGVAVIDESLPAATQFNSDVAPTGGDQGAMRIANDVSAVTFDSAGTAWFAALSGATTITLPTAPHTNAVVASYDSSNGLRGDLVNDLARGPGDRVYVATPEGIGYWNGQRFAFDIAGSSAVPSVIGLAVDNAGALWGAGQRGAWTFTNQHFRVVGATDGLPTTHFLDLAVDGSNRVWFVTADGITILAQNRAGTGFTGF